MFQVEPPRISEELATTPSGGTSNLGPELNGAWSMKLFCCKFCIRIVVVTFWLHFAYLKVVIVLISIYRMWFCGTSPRISAVNYNAWMAELISKLSELPLDYYNFDRMDNTIELHNN